jgi:iron complex transport system substrate-binding protein
MLTRRATIALGAALGVAPTACSRAPAGRAGDVIAAGQPAAVLIWATARRRLAGWPRRPDPDCLEGLAAGAAGLPELGSLAGPGRAADLETIAALRPSLVLDYGDTDPQNLAQVERVRQRLGVEMHLLDGALQHIPAAFRQAGGLLDVAARGEDLATVAEGLLARWRAAPAGPAFYYARGADGLETGFRGALATEVLEGARWDNVAQGSSDIGRVTLEQVVAWDPEALVTLNPAFARMARETPAWRRRRDGSLRRILLFPDRPFGWIDRPPSVNRLLGCAWLASPDDGAVTLSVLSRRLYGMAPAEIQRPRWID